MADSYLTRTPSGAGSRVKWTYSVWLKRSKLGHQPIWAATTDSNNYDEFYFNSTDKIQFSTVTSGTQKAIRTTRQFRDTSAWYHIVLVYDTGNSTDTDHAQLWINGVRETSFEDTTLLASGANNVQSNWNNNIEMKIGRVTTNTAAYFEGYMSHAAFVNDAVVAPTSFGETDSTSGIWKFKSPSGITWGTNGFHLKFENSGNLGLDSSGQTNNFTTNGNLKQSLDTPSNNHCTLNPNDVMRQRGGILKPTYSNGNLTMSNGSNDNRQAFGSLSPETGKWYYEMKIDVAATTGHRIGIFFSALNDKTHSGSYYYGPDAFYIHQNGEIYYNGSSTTYMASYTANDIISVALDITNGNIYMSKNGGANDSTWADGSGNNNQAFPGTSINGKLSATWPAAGTPITPFFDVYGNGNKQSINFGSGFFGTTAISSAGSNGNGSLFEYDVPSGYYALNTKNLNTYG